ncbi:glyceraldehyde-3-phosphate dehydrogenase, type I [Kwoniella mangroviensis CBS 10435]|uniref:Glyceraldehyde-3-phosphate dehydrogenase, type I n=1 Tax=Kwoniella mangroviensis CBS 10435 TaxID=1331196 RepID=A0A1B9IV95_9TREE|nr:glyceraldehyde-3-phosphate dehydrogenase, type I [Kwoniella mangroviensis CBS 8507]OCF59354.1 glyceraldehyde-3-phosphate dehydrogenase, type I [Kwoniella mangroviensis CBS 10435]OCF62580.1 glyceraldehyde-3-phosphate dehydrogenase, type I [Kwoniella mangroviensis CBS 8507]OCF76397.1 glyceraldehyde-3-phosphate dehydrogenase, type I [Kwoniella mangroviensis CBS 8886]
MGVNDRDVVIGAATVIQTRQNTQETYLIAKANMPIAVTEQSSLPKVGINGFGRIGRALFRLLLEREDLLLVAVNHTAHSSEHLMTAIMHDSTHGRFRSGADLSISLIFRGRIIHLFSERDATKLDWSSANADYIMESTGKLTTKEKAEVHIKHGKAKKVLISAPSKDTLNCVYGVNHHVYIGKDDVLSNASCTTNCLAPLALVLQRAFGVETGMMTTIHASTASQKVLDGFSTKDIRQGRSAMGNIIPATTGAAQAVVKVLPELAGKFHGISVRVPVTNVSLVDLTVTLSTPVASKEALIRPFRAAAARRPIQSSTPHPDGPALAGVLGVSDEKLVSSDYLSSTQSSILDVDATVMLNDRTAKIVAWYDNEWGFSSRSK